MNLRPVCAVLRVAAALGGLLIPSGAHATIYHYYYDAAARVIGVTSERSQLKSYRYDNNDNRSSALLQIPTGPSSSQQLLANQSLFQDSSLTSASGVYVLTLQGDGNLVLFHSGNPIWGSGTSLKGGSLLIMQGDGNLCIYDPQYNSVWSTGTTQSGSRLVLQDDGNLVVYNSSNVGLWQSGTSGK